MKNKQILTVQPDIAGLNYFGIALGLLFLRLKAIHEWIRENPNHKNKYPNALKPAKRDLALITKDENGDIERHAEDAYEVLFQFSNEAAQ